VESGQCADNETVTASDRSTPLQFSSRLRALLGDAAAFVLVLPALVLAGLSCNGVLSSRADEHALVLAQLAFLRRALARWPFHLLIALSCGAVAAAWWVGRRRPDRVGTSAVGPLPRS
jgi:hypothetical protein